MAQREAIMRALKEAMGVNKGPSRRPGPARRQRGIDRATMMDALEEKEMGMGGRGMQSSLRPKLRPKSIGASPSGGTRGIDPAENYSAEDLQRLLQSARGAVSKFKKGGAVKKKKRSPNKPSKGCVMSGRGGKYKGMK